MPRVAFDDLQSAIAVRLRALGYSPERASLAARLTAETDLDGVYTHGLARFARMTSQIQAGVVDVLATPQKVSAFGAIERWDGRRGPGNLNAFAAMHRAIALAREHGLGAVALSNTNHWMRGGTYGWQAANSGCFAIAFTNTLANLPAWGTAAPTLGNNPLVIAIPRGGGAHVVLDMAMSQYSYGTLAAYAGREEQLPYPGGFNSDGKLTTDPKEIQASERALPIGLWKGSGLALTLDLLAAMLSGGQSTHLIPRDAVQESGLSQVFLAIDPSHLTQNPQSLNAIADSVLANLAAAEPLVPGKPARYPGEQTLRTRRDNLAQGIPVDDKLWQDLIG